MPTAHTSKPSTFVIDCRSDDLDGAAAFWVQALRRPPSPPQPGDDRYRDLSCMPAKPAPRRRRRCPSRRRIALLC